jgi:hypothetical protein
VAPSPVEGTMVGEIISVNRTSKDSDLVFEGSKRSQKIKEINVLGTVYKHEFLALGLLSERSCR